MNLYEAEVHIYFDGNAEPSIVRYLIEADEIRDVGRTAEKLADDSCSVNPSSVVCMRSHRVALPYRFPDPPPNGPVSKQSPLWSETPTASECSQGQRSGPDPWQHLRAMKAIKVMREALELISGTGPNRAESSAPRAAAKDALDEAERCLAQCHPQEPKP